ncbi:MAG: trigger factor [Thermoleophilia bacterium]
MQTTVAELPENKVRLEVEVPPADVLHAFEHAASDLAQNMRVPGFRKGKKVPLPVIAARIGREALAAEAVRSHIDGWFWNAALEAGVRPVADPEVEWDDLPKQGGPFAFRAVVDVAPKPVLGDWSTLEVPAARPEVPAEMVEAEIDRLRESIAELVPVTDRPAQEGDTLVIDLKGEDETGDYVVELGGGRLRDEIEQVLVGASAGETKIVELELEDGKQVVQVTVKEIKQRVLPDADDELARSASEFDTIAELRDDVRTRLEQQLEGELEVRFREDALDALAAASQIEGVDVMVRGRAAGLWEGMVRSLARRGIQPEAYLQMTGQTIDDVQVRLVAEADRSVRRELVLETAAEQLGIEVDDAEIDELIRTQAGEVGDDPEKAIELIRERGGYDRLREDVRLRKALDRIVADVKKIPVSLAEAREKLWTPDKEKEEGASAKNIWTPGSEEPK